LSSVAPGGLAAAQILNCAVPWCCGAVRGPFA